MSKFALLLLVVTSCRREKDNTAPIAQNPDLVFEVSYESEVVARMEVLGDPAVNKLDLMDQTRAIPLASRSKTKISVYKDGASEWLIRKLTPITQIPAFNREIPADDSRQTVETQISRSGQHRYFDAQGGLIRTVQGEPFSFINEVEALQNKGTAQANPAALVLNLNLDAAAILSQARGQGAIVNELEGGLVSIRQPRATNPAARGTGSNLTEVTIINPALKMVMGTTVYDKSEIVSEVFYRYASNPTGEPVLDLIHQKNYKTLSTGKKAVYIINTSIEGIQLVNNLN